MDIKGAGAKIAWSIASARVMKELGCIVVGHLFKLLDYEEGEVQRKALLAAYTVARANGSLTIQKFADGKSFSEAVGQVLAKYSSSDLFDLLMQESERKGVYRLTRTVLTEYASRLLSYDGNSILAATHDGRHGVLLDIEEVGSASVTFELESW